MSPSGSNLDELLLEDFLMTHLLARIASIPHSAPHDYPGYSRDVNMDQPITRNVRLHALTEFVFVLFFQFWK